MLNKKVIEWMTNPLHKVCFYNFWICEQNITVSSPQLQKKILEKRNELGLKNKWLKHSFLPEGGYLSNFLEGKAEEVLDKIYIEHETRCDVGYIDILGQTYLIKSDIFKRVKSWINSKSNIKVCFYIKVYRGAGGTTESPFLIIEDMSTKEKITCCSILEQVEIK